MPRTTRRVTKVKNSNNEIKKFIDETKFSAKRASRFNFGAKKSSPGKKSSPETKSVSLEESNEKIFGTKKSSQVSSVTIVDSSDKDRVKVEQECEKFKMMYDQVKEHLGEKVKRKVKENAEDNQKQKDSYLDYFDDPASPEKKTQTEKDEIMRLKRKLEKYQSQLKKYKDITKQFDELVRKNECLSKNISKTNLELAEKQKKQEDTADCIKEANKIISELRVTICKLKADNDETASKKRIEQLEYELQQSQLKNEERMAELQARDVKIHKLQLNLSCGKDVKNEANSECDEELKAIKKELKKLKSKMAKMKDLLKIKEKEINMYTSLASDSDDNDKKVMAKLVKNNNYDNKMKLKDEDNPLKNLEIMPIIKQKSIILIEPEPKNLEFSNPDFDVYTID